MGRDLKNLEYTHKEHTQHMADKIPMPSLGLPTYPELVELLKDHDLSRLQQFLLTQDVSSLQYFRNHILKPVLSISSRPLLRQQLKLVNAVIKHKQRRRTVTPD